MAKKMTRQTVYERAEKCYDSKNNQQEVLMKRFRRPAGILLLIFALIFAFCGCDNAKEAGSADRNTHYNQETDTSRKSPGNDKGIPSTDRIDEHGTYTGKDDVMNYLIEYGRLPENYITKKEARDLGWSGGSLEPYAPGMCIGGDRYGNYEGNLPDVKGRSYYECDIDTLGKKQRGAKRIVFSDDGNIYYTQDHYTTFTLLYGDDGK